MILYKFFANYIQNPERYYSLQAYYIYFTMYMKFLP